REAQVAHGDVPARRRDHYGLELDLLRMHRAALQLLDLGQHGGLELLALAGRGGEPLLGALHVADVLGARRGPVPGGRSAPPPAEERAQNGARDVHGPGLELLLLARHGLLLAHDALVGGGQLGLVALPEPRDLLVASLARRLRAPEPELLLALAGPGRELR